MRLPGAGKALLPPAAAQQGEAASTQQPQVLQHQGGEGPAAQAAQAQAAPHHQQHVHSQHGAEEEDRPIPGTPSMLAEAQNAVGPAVEPAAVQQQEHIQRAQTGSSEADMHHVSGPEPPGVAAPADAFGLGQPSPGAWPSKEAGQAAGVAPGAADEAAQAPLPAVRQAPVVEAQGEAPPVAALPMEQKQWERHKQREGGEAAAEVNAAGMQGPSKSKALLPDRSIGPVQDGGQGAEQLALGGPVDGVAHIAAPLGTPGPVSTAQGSLAMVEPSQAAAAADAPSSTAAAEVTAAMPHTGVAAGEGAEAPASRARRKLQALQKQQQSQKAEGQQQGAAKTQGLPGLEQYEEEEEDGAEGLQMHNQAAAADAPGPSAAEATDPAVADSAGPSSKRPAQAVEVPAKQGKAKAQQAAEAGTATGKGSKAGKSRPSGEELPVSEAAQATASQQAPAAEAPPPQPEGERQDVEAVLVLCAFVPCVLLKQDPLPQVLPKCHHPLPHL